MTADMKAKIAEMQKKRVARPEIWQNDDGTWSHGRNSAVKWRDKTGCATDLRFHKDWERADAA